MNSFISRRTAAPFALCLLLACSLMASSQQPDFGPNVILLSPDQDRATMQARIDAVYKEQVHSEFGAGRYAFLLRPGNYALDVPVGFYTEVIGLGSSPDAVRINGNLLVEAALRNNNATTTFWRGVENLSVTPTQNGAMQWAVSQATFLRRVHVRGDLVLHQNHGWASGGWLADSLIDGNVDSGSQQQWISRNTKWAGWTGSNWNMVFVGAKNAPTGTYPHPPFTRVESVPVLREKPYLVCEQGKYSVVVPPLLHDTAGPSWERDSGAGKRLPLSSFYIAHAGKDSAATLNAALKQGRHLLFTPGNYDLTEALRVTRKDTVILGMGFATLRPTAGTAAMTVADVDGVTVAGLLFDAGPVASPALLEIGSGKSHVRHAADPIALFDVFFRVGGAAAGKTVTNLAIHSNDTLVDHTWIWRADHGAGVGWTSNTSETGLFVDGDDVTIYGLFVEHHQKFQVQWNGERGRTYFYQSEIPYDPPDQLSWKSSSETNGWAAYKVGARVQQHEAWGLGIYSVFQRPGVTQSRAIEVPESAGVRLHHMITVALGTRGEISHIVNDAGEATVIQPKRIDRTLSDFPLNSDR